jgi:23S rRNA (cytosine1962-C5)-methyltransferase
MNAQVIVHESREKPILNQHPWVFSRGITAIKGSPLPGDIVDVVSEKGKFLARGYWNPKSQIQVRLLTWDNVPVDEWFWRDQLERAISARDIMSPHTGTRVINAESDYLSGLVVDQYGDWLVLQALTLGIDSRKQQIASLLADVYQQHGRTLHGVYERSDIDMRGKEGLKSSMGVLWGEEPPASIPIIENGIHFSVDVRRGHKTGFYLDQRGSRQQLTQLVRDDYAAKARPLRVLNLFSYTGGFGLAALHGAGTHPVEIVNVDSSHEVLTLAEANFVSNGWIEGESPQKVEFIQANVFDLLRGMHADGEQFDVIVCDPPKFAQNKDQVDRAARGYKDLNLQCFRLLRRGGHLFTFSCSGAIDALLMQKIVFGALADSGRQAQILSKLGAAVDHPVALTFPEGEYLKGLLLRVY